MDGLNLTYILFLCNSNRKHSYHCFIRLCYTWHSINKALKKLGNKMLEKIESKNILSQI